jgi:hypothetical protein
MLNHVYIKARIVYLDNLSKCHLKNSIHPYVQESGLPADGSEEALANS